MKDLLLQLLEKKTFDAVLVSVRVPAKDSYAYVLVQDPSLFEEAAPLSPVMPVPGAKALSRLTRLGKGSIKIAAVLRPCEVRAAIELDKLGQVELGNITLISIDCPGTLPLSGYLANPEAGEETFKGSVMKWDSSPIRDICKMCDNMSMVAGDLHVGTLGAKDGTFFLIAKTQKGEDVLAALGVSAEGSLDPWEKKVEEVAAQRKGTREQPLEKFGPLPPGVDRLLEVFGDCINCHNCSRVCPICYCQLCYFDSDAVKHPADDQLQRARSSGSLRLPSDTLLFHVHHHVTGGIPELVAEITVTLNTAHIEVDATALGRQCGKGKTK